MHARSKEEVEKEIVYEELTMEEANTLLHGFWLSSDNMYFYYSDTGEYTNGYELTYIQRGNEISMEGVYDILEFDSSKGAFILQLIPYGEDVFPVEKELVFENNGMNHTQIFSPHGEVITSKRRKIKGLEDTANLVFSEEKPEIQLEELPSEYEATVQALRNDEAFGPPYTIKADSLDGVTVYVDRVTKNLFDLVQSGEATFQQKSFWWELTKRFVNTMNSTSTAEKPMGGLVFEDTSGNSEILFFMAGYEVVDFTE